MPAWVFLELSSFGAFADFYLFCANRWGDSGMRDEHYMLRRSKMRNPRILQMAVLAYAYSRFVPREKAEGTPERLLALADRSKLHGDWYASNTVITSSHDFIARVFEAWLG